MWAKTSRRTPCRRASTATSRTAAWPPVPPAKRIGRDQPAASAHEVRARRPRRKAQELGRPHDPPPVSHDHVAVRRMRSVHHRHRADLEAGGSVLRDAGLQASEPGQPPDPVDELCALVGQQPCVELVRRRDRSGPAVEHDPSVTILDEQARRRESRRIHRAHAGQHQPERSSLVSCHDAPAPALSARSRNDAGTCWKPHSGSGPASGQLRMRPSGER
jgi:hypothetical protein